jgi:hypothetical protein
MSLLTKMKDVKVEPAFITSIDKVKGRVGLFLKNGLSTTGTYLYDINDLRVGLSVIVSKVDNFYVIINLVNADSVKKSFAKTATFTMPDPNLEPVPPVEPPEPPIDCQLVLTFDGTDGGTDFEEEHGLQPILPLSIINGDPMALSEFCAIDYSRYNSSPSSLKMFYQHPDWRDPAYTSPTRLAYDIGVRLGDFTGTFYFSIDQFDPGNHPIDFLLRSNDGTAYIETGFYKNGSTIIMYWYCNDFDGTYIGGDEVNVTSSFLMTSWNKLEWIVVGKNWTVKLNDTVVLSVDGISYNPFLDATIMEFSNWSETEGTDFWLDTASICGDPYVPSSLDIQVIAGHVLTPDEVTFSFYAKIGDVFINQSFTSTYSDGYHHIVFESQIPEFYLNLNVDPFNEPGYPIIEYEMYPVSGWITNWHWYVPEQYRISEEGTFPSSSAMAASGSYVINVPGEIRTDYFYST